MAQEVVIDELFGASSSWAPETDDSFALARAGCIEGLTRVDFEGKVVPSLATSWEPVGADAWDFKLRKNVTFHDGTPVTAEAVVTALRHVLQAPVPPPTFSPKEIASVEAVDPGTVRIKTKEPMVLIPFTMSSPNTGILSPAAYSGDRVSPVKTCTGPFVIVEDIPQQGLKLVRNENYWGERPRLASAVVRFIPDASVRATQVRTGESQISRYVPFTAEGQLSATKDIELFKVNVPRTTILYLNNQSKFLKDERLRRAIQAAIDVPSIIAGVYEGFARPAAGPFPADSSWAPADNAPVSQDLDVAKRLIGEAGYEPGALELKLITYSERAQFKDLAAVIQDQLAAIGVKVKIQIADWAAIEPDLMQGNFDLALMSRGYMSHVADPLSFLTTDYTCDGGFNLSRFCDRELDAEVAKARGEFDAERRADIYRKIAQRLQREAVDVFLIHEQQIDAVNESVSNYKTHPLDFYVLTPELSVR